MSFTLSSSIPVAHRSETTISRSNGPNGRTSAALRPIGGLLPPYDAGSSNQPCQATGNTAYLWDVAGSLPLLLKDGSTAYVYGPGGLPLEQVNTSATYWYHHDQLGSTRLVTNSTGGTAATYTFDPYGGLASSTNPGGITSPFGFCGQYQDSESGLYYLRARYYDPVIAQFISRDPGIAATREPYGYTDGAALNQTDLTGLWGGGTTTCVSAAAGLVYGAGASGCIERAWFSNDSQNSGKLFACGGAFAGGTANYQNFGWSWPNSGPTTGQVGALGASVGFGKGLFFTTASSAKQLEGVFHNVDVEVGPIGLNIGVSASDASVFQITATFNPLSWGASIAQYDTNTSKPAPDWVNHVASLFGI